MLRPFDATRYPFAAFDLDETLLSRGRLSDFTAETIARLSARGVEVIIATGRALSLIPTAMTRLPCIRYIVSACGACVTDNTTGETIWSAPLDGETVSEILRRGAKHRAGACAYYDGVVMHSWRALRRIYRNEPPETVAEMKREFDLPKTAWLRRHIRRHGKPVLKLDLYFRTHPELVACWEELRDIDGIRLSDSPGVCIEITRADVGKAGGLAALLAHLNAAPDSVVAFGDSGNDLDMLAFAGFAVAMDTAPPEGKRLADYIAPPASEDGAARAMIELYSLGTEGGA